MKLVNALSLQMVGDADTFGWQGRRITAEEATSLFKEEGLESFVGHTDTATVVSGLLGLPVPFHRGFVTLEPGETLVVAQVWGGRLPEGTTTLPDGVEIRFWLVQA